jgi:ketosteroid isomerase-like protein
MEISSQAADMKRMKLFFQMAAAALFLTCGLTLTGADRYTSERDEKMLAKTVTDLDAAVLKSDATALGKLISDEYTFIDPAGKSMGKSEELAGYRNGHLKIAMLTRSDSKTRLYVGGGIVTSLVTIKGKYKDEDISGDYRSVEVFEPRKSGDWQLYFSQVTKVPEKN